MRILVTFPMVLIAADLIFGKVSYERHQVWRVIPDSAHALNILQELGNTYKLDFWQDPTYIGKPVDFRVSPMHSSEIRTKLESSGLKNINVIISNIQSLIDKERNSRKYKSNARASAGSLATFDYSVYHPAEEVYEWMDLVVAEHGGFASKEQFGVTYQGRPMYILKFEKRPSPIKKPVIFVDALIHCREWITTASLMFIFKEMLRNPDYTQMIDGADWYFVPMINVDGYVETWTGDRLWRKTRSTGASSQCVGVDGNRNWDAFWSSPGASPIPCSLVYYGPTAFSESEVRHLAKYTTEFQENVAKIDAFVSTHSYSQLILYPYNYSPVPSPDDEVLNITSKLMNEAIYGVHGKYYTYGPGYTTIYGSSGTTTDWTYEKAKIALSYTYELRDTGEYAFLLPDDQIIPNGEEYLAGLKALYDYVVDNFEGSGM